MNLKRCAGLVVLITITLFFIAHRVIYFVPGFFETCASCITYPLLHVQRTLVAPVKNYCAHRAHINQLIQERAQLAERCAALESEVIAYAAYKEFHESNKELIEFARRYDYKSGHLVQIIARTMSDRSRTLAVDRGSKHGIKKNMVAVYKHCLVGRVIEVYPFYSLVQLVTDPACRVAAYCQKTKAHGVHAGNRDGGTVLDHVSHLASIIDGDRVISSGQGLIYPKGFGLAKIVSYYKEGLFYTITCEPLVDPAQISYCYLIKKGVPLSQ